MLARLQVYSNAYADALSNIENALLLNPNNSTAHALRGWIKGFQGEWLEAEASMKKAIEIDPNNAVAYAYYAEVLANQSQAGAGSLGTLDKAIEMSKKAKSLAPDIIETHRARGLVLEITANYPEAVSEFEAAVALDPNIADLHMSLGRNYRFLQEYDKAVDQFNRANALNPADPLPETYISRTYSTVGEFGKAVQYAESAVKDAPSDPMMLGNLGTMYYRSKEYKNAIAPLRLAIQGGSTKDGETVKGLSLDYGRVAEFYYTYGLALAKTGECGEGLRISQLLQEGVPNDETAVYNAQEIITVCRQVGSETPVPEETTSPDATNATPEQGLTPQETPAANP